MFPLFELDLITSSSFPDSSDEIYSDCELTVLEAVSVSFCGVGCCCFGAVDWSEGRRFCFFAFCGERKPPFRFGDGA